MTTLHTPRLTLRHWRESDRDPWAALVADPIVMEFFPSTQDRTTADSTFDRLSSALDERGWGLWAVDLEGEFIGFTGLAPVTIDVPFAGATEVGWRLAAHAWGHGYATEAARAAVDYAFGPLGLSELVSMTSTLNVRSRAVMERLGMTHDAAEDFEHPSVPEGSRLRAHVLYRLRS